MKHFLTNSTFEKENTSMTTTNATGPTCRYCGGSALTPGGPCRTCNEARVMSRVRGETTSKTYARLFEEPAGTRDAGPAVQQVLEAMTPEKRAALRELDGRQVIVPQMTLEDSFDSLAPASATRTEYAGVFVSPEALLDPDDEDDEEEGR
jgi:hypothetical protein